MGQKQTRCFKMASDTVGEKLLSKVLVIYQLMRLSNKYEENMYFSILLGWMFPQ